MMMMFRLPVGQLLNTWMKKMIRGKFMMGPLKLLQQSLMQQWLNGDSKKEERSAL
jgi:hypothetical protein